MQKSSAKFQIIVFIILTFTISWTEEYFIAKSGGIQNSLRAFCLMWTPGIVGLILSFYFGSRFKDIGFRKGNLKSYLLAYFVPAITSLLILILLILTGLGEFQIDPILIDRVGNVKSVLMRVLIFGPTIGALLGFVSGLGEEIGWRGFLHSRLVSLKIKHPFLITGIIWAIWHWPLILFSDYATSAHPAVSLILFTLSILSYSVFMGYLREKSGSVFTAGLAHGAHNLWIQGIYPAFILKGELDPYFGGESGLFIVVIYLCVAGFIYRKLLTDGRVLDPAPNLVPNPA